MHGATTAFLQREGKEKKKNADYSGEDISSRPAEAALGFASRPPVK